MTIHCFTSFSFSYLAKARVLAHSLKKHHPDWHLSAVITDRQPQGFNFDIANEMFDDVIWGDEIFGAETPAWLFKHDVIEVCTAVKGPVLKRLAELTGSDKIFYFDPDIAIFSSLDPLVESLDDESILLTPHQLEPDTTHSAILDNEVCSLRYGTYNLGFIGVRTDREGLRFANWWSDRLSRYCYDDPSIGIFVDQKWCELVPAFFDRVKIVRDPGCNVASWNLSTRKLAIGANGDVLVNGSPLRFFHFTKLGPIGDVMTQRYARENTEVYEIWSWYKRQVDRHTDPAIPQGWWKYGKYSNGVPITKEARVLYRERADLQSTFPDPFEVEGNSYYAWLKREQRLDPAKSRS